ncbi:MAG: glycosyltransferase [Helicobacteraceae bacterium]|jgi:glycosyltransferase involved in cell wall biosynthesis|nr:glycosyltransferase [Helicobacteraceae bacterium]
MNILFALYEREYNDAVWHALNIASALQSDGHDIRIALETNSPIARAVKEAKLPIERILSAKSGLLAYMHQRATFKALRSRFRVNLLVSYGKTPSGAGQLKEAHRINAVCGVGEKIGWIKGAKRVIAASKAVKADLIERYGLRNDRVFVVYGGLDPLSESERQKRRAEVRAKFELSEENVLIGILGDLDEYSGHKLLVEALVSRYHKNLKLIAFTYDDSQIEPFRRLCRQYNISSVALAETIKGDNPRLLCALDVGVIASLKPNGTARRAIALIAAGVSVVATALSADGELANGKNRYDEPYPAVLLDAIIAHEENDALFDRASLRAAWGAAIKNMGAK